MKITINLTSADNFNCKSRILFNKPHEYRKMMEIVIKVNNISQIRQIAESLPEKFLSETVLNNEPILNYLRNTLIFHREKKIFSIEYLNKMFVLN